MSFNKLLQIVMSTTLMISFRLGNSRYEVMPVVRKPKQFYDSAVLQIYQRYTYV